MSDALPVFDRGDFLRRLGGDEMLLVDVIRVVIEDCPGQLAAIKAAVDDGSAERIKQSAHLLKGVAATISAPRLLAAAEVMEWIGIDARFDASVDAWHRLSDEAATLISLLRRELPPS